MNDLKLSIKLTADGRALVSVVNDSKQSLQQLTGELGRAGSAGHTAANQLGALEQQGQKTGLTLTRVAQAVGTAFAAIGAANLAQRASQELMAYQDLRTRLQQLSGTAAAYADNQNYLITLANKHHKAVNTLGDSYASLLNLQDAGLLNQRQSRAILEGMSNIQSALGASSEQLSQAMYGLSQALDMPVVNAENFNQVVEPLPGLLNKLTKASHAGAGGFRQLVLDGKVTSAMFRDTLIKALQEYEGSAEATGKNLSALYRDNANAWQQLVVAYERPINDTLSSLLGNSAALMQLAAANADVLSLVLGTTLAAAMGRGIAALGAHSASLIKDAMASERNRIATLQAAQAELALATAQRAGVITAGQAIVAEARLVAAREAMTVATTQATLATRALGGATALLGGWPGIILMAAGGWYAFTQGADSAADSVGTIDERVKSLLGNIQQLNRDQLDAKMRALQSQYQLQLSGIVAIDEQINKLAANRTYGQGQYAAIQVQIDGLKAKRAQLEAERDALSQAMQQVFGKAQEINQPQWQGEGDKPGLDPALQKKADELLQNLTKQVALYGKVSEVAKLRYELEHGALKGLAPEMADKLLKEAEALDKAKLAEEQAKKTKDAETARKDELKKLLGVLDPTAAANQRMAEAEALLKAHFEAANVPLAERARLLAVLKAQHEEQSDYGKLRGQLDPTFAENQQHQQNMGILDAEILATPEDQVAQLAYLNGLKELEAERHAEAMGQINGSMTANYDALWKNTFDRFAQGIGQTTADALMESKSFGEGMQNLAKGAVKTVIAGLVEIGAKKLMMAALDKGIMTNTAATATATAATTGTSVAASMAPAAMTSSVATFGGSAMAGMAAMIAAMAIIPSIIGIAHDGLPLNRNEGTFLLRRDEMVLNPKQRDNFEDMVAFARGGKGGGGNHVQITQHNRIVVANQAEASTLEEVLPQLVEMTKSAVVDDLNSRGDVWRARG